MERGKERFKTGCSLKDYMTRHRFISSKLKKKSRESFNQGHARAQTFRLTVFCALQKREVGI